MEGYGQKTETNSSYSVTDEIGLTPHGLILVAQLVRCLNSPKAIHVATFDP